MGSDPKQHPPSKEAEHRRPSRPSPADVHPDADRDEPKGTPSSDRYQTEIASAKQERK